MKNISIHYKCENVKPCKLAALAVVHIAKKVNVLSLCLSPILWIVQAPMVFFYISIYVFFFFIKNTVFDLKKKNSICIMNNSNVINCDTEYKWSNGNTDKQITSNLILNHHKRIIATKKKVIDKKNNTWHRKFMSQLYCGWLMT